MTGLPACPIYPFLEVQFQSKLKLPRIKRRRWAAVVTAIAGALGEGIDFAKQWRSGGFVKAIEHIEAFRDQIQPGTLAEANGPHNAQVERSKLVCDSHISSQGTVREEWRQNERAIRIHIGSIVGALLIAIGVNAGDDVER